MTKTLTPVRAVKRALGQVADTVGKTKNGTVMVRRGYFFRNGASSQTYAARVADLLNAAGVQFRIEDRGDHWAPFVGKGSVARNSHFYVELTVL